MTNTLINIIFLCKQVRDVKGQKHAITLYGPHVDQVEVNKTYKFQDLKVSPYKALSDNWQRLESNPKTKIVEAEPEVAEGFASFYDGDAKFSGFILGNEPPYFYASCPKCSKAWKDNWASDKCGNCSADMESMEKIKDFHVTISIQDHSDDSLLHKVFFFRKHLDLDTATMSKEDVEKALDNLTFKACEVTYNNPKDEEDGDVKKGTSIKISSIKMLDS